MLSFSKIPKFRALLVAAALLIAAASLFYSHSLTRALYAEEVAKMDVWAQAMRSLTAPDEATDFNLVLKVINSNHTIPVVVTDAHGNILTQRNLHVPTFEKDTVRAIAQEAERIKTHGEMMRMSLSSNSQSTADDFIYIYYEESVLLRQLTLYPYLQLGVIAIFFAVAIVALLASKKAEQNRVWVGLSRETAHQLGTPISSLMAWSEVLRESYPDDPLLPEMDKDIRRLERIAERFSKIGSAPELKKQEVGELVKRVAAYYDRRTSQKVKVDVSLPPYPIFAMLNAPLFEWVIENLCKNAVDAMQGVGQLKLSVESEAIVLHHHTYLRILVSDTGKGIPHKDFKTVFKPGFTTKKRGWGLGLSLAKRIVEEYHNGRIYVMNSQVGKGTTFAVEIREIEAEGEVKDE